VSQPTNATKATIIALVNAAFGLLAVFDVALTETQKGAIASFVNLAMLAYVGFTYRDSPKRIPDEKASLRTLQ
jgi:hypothetical protein